MDEILEPPFNINETSEFLKNKLVDILVEKKIIQNKKIESAFRKVNRHFFVHNADLEDIYGDYSIITKEIGNEPISSSTAPSLMATMLEQLSLEKGLKVLEIGTGVGYNAALLSEIVENERNVFTVDIDVETINEAKQSLINAGYKNINIKCSDGIEGLPEDSPFDRIIVTCAVRDISKAWIEQLKNNGVIVLPIWINGTQITPAFKKQDNILVGLSTSLGGFMSMRRKSYHEILQESPPKNKNLLICSEHSEFLKEDKINSLLREKYHESKNPLNGFSFSQRYNFFIFLALHEKNSIELFVENKGSVLEYGFGEQAMGILDLENKTACLNSKNNKLITYGNEQAYQKMLFLIKKWENLNRPSVNELQVKGYLSDQDIPPLEKNEILVNKPSVKLVIKHKA